MSYYRCGPTAIGSRTSWGPVSSPALETKSFDRPLSGNFDRIFNAFERTNAFEYVRNTFEGKDEERHVGHGDVVVNRKMSSSFERADCALAAQTPISEDEEFYREKILYSQARQLFPLQEDLADWINKTIGITYLTGENFLDVLDNGAELCQLAAVIHDKAREAIDQGLIVGPVPAIRGRCWQRAARRSFFSRDNTENFLTFCRELGVHENLLFESDDLVLHNQPRQVILCLLEVARLATRYGLEPPGLVQLEKEIAMEERDSGLDSAMSGAAWQFRDTSPAPTHKSTTDPPPSPDPNDSGQLAVPDSVDNESTKSDGQASTDSDVPLKPTNELDKRVQLVTRLMERGCSCSSGKCSKLLKVKKVGEGRYNIAGRNVFIRLLKGRHMMVRVGGGWDTLEHFLSRHEPCQVRLVAAGRRVTISQSASPASERSSSPADGPPASPRPRASPPAPARSRAGLALPLRDPPTRTRKQSAPAVTPPARTPRTPPAEHRKSLPAFTRPRGTSVAPRTRAASAASTPVSPAPRPARSNSLAGSPAAGRTARSTSLVTGDPRAAAITVSGALTQAAIEETIRLSLAATIADERTDSKKPFLHIKAKYRSPPPREVPPR